MYSAFNGDHLIEEHFRLLVQKHNIQTIIETGTFTGNSTAVLSTMVPSVVTIEINPEVDSSHLLKCLNVQKLIGNSPDKIPEAVSSTKPPYLFFLDAHWNYYCPLLDELKVIANLHLLPVIAIHDFQVPNTTLGYDTYGGQKYCWEWIQPSVDAIYGYSYTMHFNDESAQGARRGIVYIEPRCQ